MRFLKVPTFLALALIPQMLFAELAPSAYEAMQAKAPEYVRMEVLRVDVAPGKTPAEQNVHVVAMVTEVTRTATGLKPDQIINITYTVNQHPAGWTGPGEVPLLNEQDSTLAYLSKSESGAYLPAAGRMTFSNF